jgi:uncharacterized membrane protein YcaP (DUF421 family)
MGHFKLTEYRNNLHGLKIHDSNLQSPQMLTSWHTVLEIVGRTAAVYVLVLLGIRLTGKREVGQMTPFDLTLLLLLSNSVQNAMTGPDTSLLGGATAALVLLVLNFLLAELSGVNRRFRKMIQGQPTLLVHNGECITPHMAKEHISMDELNRALREHGVGCVGDAALVVLEVDGSMSVLKYDDVPNHTKPQKRLKFLHRN